MAFGIEVYNSSGVVTLSENDRMGRFYGSYEVVGTGSVIAETFVTIPGMTADGKWIAYGGGADIGSDMMVRMASGGFYYRSFPNGIGTISGHVYKIGIVKI